MARSPRRRTLHHEQRFLTAEVMGINTKKLRTILFQIHVYK
jgi:hypothetical protein